MMRDHEHGPITGESHWSLLKLNPQKQKGYLELLQEHYPHIERYFPTYNRLCRPHGARKAKIVSRPVFPGYVFMKVGAEHIRGPTTLPVSARWVRFGGRIEWVPDAVIQRLRVLEKANELVKEVTYASPWVPGARVLVHLPVADVQCVIVRLVNGDRAEVCNDRCRIVVPIHKLVLS